MPGHVYVQTFGCQMNEYDSARMVDVLRESAGLEPTDKWLLRLVLVALAVHAVTDNVLISSPACVFFAFLAAALAQGEGTLRFALPDARRVA